MILASLVDALHSAGVGEGDILYVSSDIAKLGIPAEVKPEIKQKGMAALTNMYIDTLLSVIGESGTLIMPTFTYSACDNKVFEVSTTPSTVGMLTEAFRQSPDTIRSEHPIFSCAFYGKQASTLAKVQNFDCFGENSLYDRLHKLEAKYLMLGVNMWQGSTYVYYSEQKRDVPYRYMKDFDATIDDGVGKKNVITPYFVRDYDVGYEDAWEALQEDSLDQGITKSATFLAGKLLVHNATDIDLFIQEKLNEDLEYLIRYT